MRRAAERFWRCYRDLPDEVREMADKSFKRLKKKPKHPSLQFKKVGEMWSERVGQAHRALAVEDGTGFIRVWIGSHDDYEKMIKRR